MLASKREQDDLRNVILDEIIFLKSLQTSLFKDHDKEHAETLGRIIYRLENKTQASSDKGVEMVVQSGKKQKMGKGLEEQSQRSKVKKPRQKLQIMNPLKSEISHNFSFALMKMMNDFDCKYSEVNDEMDDNVPLIVVCPKMSRLKPDVDLAIQSVRRSAPYVAIILHIGSERNLPALPSNQKLREYRNITFVDMGCDDQGAIYNCQHNTEANVQLRSNIGVPGTNQPDTSKLESKSSLSTSSAYRVTPPTNNISDFLWGQLLKLFPVDSDDWKLTSQRTNYRQKATFDDVTNYVALVIDAKKMHDGPSQEYLQNIELLKVKIRSEEITRVCILLQVDKLCGHDHEDVSNIFSSVKFQKAMKTACELFSNERTTIHPIISYGKLSSSKDIPGLLALRPIMPRMPATE